MGGLSATHLLILIGIGIFLFAPRRIGDAGRSLGEAVRGFKKGLKGDEIDVTPPEAIDQKDKDRSDL